MTGGGTEGVRYFFRGKILARQAVMTAGSHFRMPSDWFTMTSPCGILGAELGSAAGLGGTSQDLSGVGAGGRMAGAAGKVERMDEVDAAD
jgi:hypothetical protein